MNIANTEIPLAIVAKTCGCREKNSRKVTYAFVDAYHNLCIDKKDIILSELEACEKLLRYPTQEDETDTSTIETEIAQLKMVLDLMP